MRLVLAALIMSTVVIGSWFTSGGMFVGAPDSIAYEGAASNISSGRGLTTPFALLTERASPLQQVAWGSSLPLSEQPPGYPLALAATGALGFSQETGAQIVSILGLALLAAAVAGAAGIGLGRRPLPIVALTALAVVGPSTSVAKGVAGGPLPMAPAVLSERLALPLSLLAITIIALRLPKIRSLTPNTLDQIRLTTAAVIVFFSTMTRYTGFACGVACAVAIAVDGRRTRRSRVIWASVLMAIGPVTIIGISALVGGTPKVIEWHPLPIFEPMVDVMSDWFLIPKTLPLALRVSALLVLIVAPLILAISCRGRNPDRRVLALALATFNLTYACSVIFTVLLLDTVVGINQRLMAPIQASVYLLLAVEIFEIAGRYVPKMQSASLALIILMSLVLAIPTFTKLAEGKTTWAQLNELQAIADARSPLRNIPSNTFIFTDDPPEAWNSAGLTAYKLPLPTVATTSRVNQNYSQQVDQVVAITNANDSLVVASIETQQPTDIDAYLSRGLVVLARCPDLTIIGRSGSAHTAEVTRTPCTSPDPV